MQIAIIKVAALGDVIRTTSLLRLIRARHPGCRITWITSRAAISILPPPPMIDCAVPVDDDPAAEWRKRRYDWLISLDDDEAACRLASELCVERISGSFLEQSGARIYTPDVEPWFGMGILRHASRGGMAEANRIKCANQKTFGQLLAPALGLTGDIPPPIIYVDPDARERAQRWIDENVGECRIVGLNTGAGGRWQFKKWGEQQTGAMARRIVDEIGATVVLLGGEQERDRNLRIVQASESPGVVIAPHDWPLPQFAALVGLCDLLVTSDSLAMHLAYAQRVYTIAFFGPTSAAEIDVFGRGEKVVTPLSCRCCYLSTCDVRPHCMDSIPVETMMEAVRRGWKWERR